MKGIILAGGNGTRLHPVTKAISKQLIPIYDKPLIYYPLSILMLAQIKEILIICKAGDQNLFQTLLGNGEHFGLEITYATQNQPSGIAEAFIIGEDFIKNDSVALILGDNIFWGQSLTPKLLEAKNNLSGATIFGYSVSNPERFGVIELSKSNKPVRIIEKPTNAKSNIAVTGLYFYENSVVEISKSLKPSKRNELEITDVNNVYIKRKKLDLQMLGRGYAWLDSGTPESVLEASMFVETIERRQGYKIACIEEIAYRNKWISKSKLSNYIRSLDRSVYTEYLEKIIND